MQLFNELYNYLKEQDSAGNTSEIYAEAERLERLYECVKDIYLSNRSDCL